MFESLHDKTGTLHEDDIKGIEHIYGKTNKTKPAQVDVLPERCDTDFDAATLIRKELFFFKNTYLWRPRKNQEAFKIRDIFPELPSDMTYVDAVYEAADRKIWFFIGREIYIFDGPKLVARRSLQDIGINQLKYRKIDAIFRWDFSNRTFIFSGDDYWRLDSSFKVEKDYPKEILGTWKDVYDIDTAFTDIDQLYFFKGPNAYKFDTPRMRINRMNSTRIGFTFMGCIDIGVRNPNDDRETQDVIHEYPPDEIEEDLDNPEKVGFEIEKKEPNNSNTVNTDIVYKYVIILVSFTSLCFSNMI